MVQQEPDEWIRLWFLPQALKELIAGATEGSCPYFDAMNYAYCGDADLAFEWPERAYRERDFALVEIVGELLFANIAQDPRFAAFLTRMKLPTEWTTSTTTHRRDTLSRSGMKRVIGVARSGVDSPHMLLFPGERL